MKKNAYKAAAVLFLAIVIGCQTQTTQQKPRAPVAQQSERTVAITRDLVLAYYGNNPGSGWEQKKAARGSKYWERHVTVNVDVLKHKRGPSECSLSLSQLGTLPSGEIWMEINAIGIESGDTQGNMSTASGGTLMLLVNPKKTLMRWAELIKD